MINFASMSCVVRLPHGPVQPGALDVIQVLRHSVVAVGLPHLLKFCDDHVLRQKWQRHSLPTDAIDGVIGQVRCLQPNALDTVPQRLAEVEGAASVMDARQHLTDCRPQGRLEVRHDRLHRLHCPFLTLYCLHCHLPSCHCHLQCCYFRFQNRRLAHCNLTKTTNESL